MPKQLPNIQYIHTHNNNVIDSDSAVYQIPYYKPTEYFENLESYTKFIKGCEKLVRGNDRYKKYISFLKKEVKLNRCQVLKNVTDMDAEIEMHHGPIFTLFDICAIILEYFLIKRWKISTARIADQVLTEHQNNRVQVVMLSKSIHQAVHARNIFIHYKQAYGDLMSFIDKYEIAISDEYKLKINNYIDRCLLSNSNDNGALELNKRLFEK